MNDPVQDKTGRLYARVQIRRICVLLLCIGLLIPSRSSAFTEETIYGDADGDGTVTAADARLVLRTAVGLEEPSAFSEQMDVDGDQAITATDARLILRYAVGLEIIFPIAYPFAEPETDAPQLSVSIDAPIALLYSVEDNKLLYSKNIDKKTAPASLIKLLTALTALHYCEPDQVFTVGKEIKSIGEESSLSLIRVGMHLTLEQLLYGMILPSGNDAAYCVAVNVARSIREDLSLDQAISYFVQLMNQEAKSLGMPDTVILTPDGYDKDGQYSTAKDLLTLARAALQNELIAEICATSSVTVSVDDEGELYWKNTNRYLDPYHERYDPRVSGLKGGFTDDAGYCLITSLKKDNATYIVVLLGAETVSKRYESTSALMDAIPVKPPEEETETSEAGTTEPMPSVEESTEPIPSVEEETTSEQPIENAA